MESLTIISILFYLSTVFVGKSFSTGVQTCYYCWWKCEEPLEIRDCANDFQDFRCYASHAITPNGTYQEFKGCVLSNDEYWHTRCDTLNYQPDSGCYMCDDDLCNWH
ncbi:hypothetical protein Zmor_023365 [Zophobas morio]|uniref:Uncharacterized protein n=1 Tax=Zophobas morio TaxID=2755281 RepID=A0AA38M7A4_9CUCU|nr:hypothetical protein Zmor_023365 [Zophobas morio]